MVSVIIIVGLLAAFGGGVGYFVYPKGLEIGLKTMVNLKEDGPIFPMYMNPPFTYVSRFFVFEVKNPREALKGAKIRLELRGPFNYEVKIVRSDIDFMESNKKIKYSSRRGLTLIENSSKGLDERIWLINPIIVSVHHNVRTILADRIPFQRISDPVIFSSMNVIMDSFNERLFIRTTPREILEGKVVGILDAVVGVAKRFSIDSFLPPVPPENKFGIVHAQNWVVDHFTLWSGIGDTKDKFGDVITWRNKTRLDAWSGECNTIVGTNGELHRPLVKDNQQLRVFLSPFCRSTSFDPSSDVLATTQTGLQASEYELNPRMFMGVRRNPSNRCYCSDPRTYDCQYDGLLSIGPCYYGAPIFFTRGNFNGVDKRIRNLIDFDTTKYNMSRRILFFLDKTTGAVLQANVTLIGTLKLVRQPYLRDLSKIQSLAYVPLFAAEENIVIPFAYVMPIYALQIFNNNYKLLMGGMAASGLGMLILKYFLGK